MRIFEVIIAREKYDDDGNQLPEEILFGPKLITNVYSKTSALKIAVIESGIETKDVEDAEFFVREFPREPKYDREES